MIKRLGITLFRETLVPGSFKNIRQWITFSNPTLKNSRSTEAVPAKQYSLYVVCWN